MPWTGEVAPDLSLLRRRRNWQCASDDGMASVVGELRQIGSDPMPMTAYLARSGDELPRLLYGGK